MRNIEQGDMPEPKNSWIRKTTKDIRRTITEKLHESLPWLTPTHINILGAAGVAVGAFIAEKQNTEGKSALEKLPILAVLSVASASDSIDGELATVIEEEDPQKVNRYLGQLYDGLSDRAQEFSMGLSRMSSAHNRSDKLGEIAAFISTFSSPLPSLARAKAESSKKVVPEAGKGVLGFLGTRVGRAATGIAITVFPEIKGVPIQTILDTSTSISNVATAVQRVKVILDKNIPQNLPEEKQKEAKLRTKGFIVAAGIILGASIVAYNNFNRSKN